MEKKISFFLITYLFVISIMIGGCANFQNKLATTNTTNENEQYPNKPITLIVPFSAGGGLDLVARAIEKHSIKHLGQPLIVVNKPGGTGTIGWNELAGAQPDGYTLGMTTSDMLLLSLYKTTKYDYVTALDPLVQITTIPFVMAVQAECHWQNVADLVEYAKMHPGQVKYGHPGIGSLHQLIGETFAQATNIKLEQVPFRGGSESTAALLGGHIQAVIAAPVVFNEYVKNGTIKILATTDKQRLTDPLWSQIPTFKEQGLDILFNNRYVIAAPKEMPPKIKTKLVEGLKAMIADPEFKKDIENLELQVKYLGPEEIQLKWLSDSQELAKDIQKTNILELIHDQKE